MPNSRRKRVGYHCRGCRHGKPCIGKAYRFFGCATKHGKHGPSPIKGRPAQVPMQMRMPDPDGPSAPGSGEM